MLSALSRPLSGLLALSLLAFTACRQADSRPSAPATTAEASGNAPVAATPKPAAIAALPVIGLAPAWGVKTLDGQALGRDALKGKIVVIDFWATWCPPCVHEIPGYVQLQNKYRDQGVVFVGLTADENMEQLQKFLRQRAVNYPIALLTYETASLFGETELMMPTTLLVDREGNVRHRKVGAMDTEAFEKLLVSLL